MEIEDLFRVLNIVLILVWFLFMVPLYHWWASRPKEERLILITIPLLLIIMLFSSGEALAQDLGFGVRMVLFTPILILCIFSSFKMLQKIRKINKMREEDK